MPLLPPKTWRMVSICNNGYDVPGRLTGRAFLFLVIEGNKNVSCAHQPFQRLEVP